MRFVLLLAGMLWSAAPEGQDPAKIAGHYRGSIRVQDTKDPQHKNWRYDVVLELKADGATLVGACQYLGGPLVPLRWTANKPGWFPIELEEVGRPVVWWANASVGTALSGSWRGLPGSPDGNFNLERDDSARRYFDAQSQGSRAGRIEYRIEQVPGTEHLLPRVTGFRDPRILAAVNRRLAELARQAHCAGEFEHQDIESEVGYAAEDVFSVRITRTCIEGLGGPDTEDLSVTFDLTTGDVASFVDLFREGVSDDEIARAAFAHVLAQAPPSKGTGSPGAARGSADEAECRERYTREKLTGSLLTFSFAEDGLRVRPDWGVTGNACADEVTVPYPALAPLAAAAGPLARVAAAHAGAPLRYRIHRPGPDPTEDVFYTPKD